MGRPPEPEKRRELAVRAAEVLEHEGLALSMSQLAERLEVKRSTLLYHLPTKGDIAAEALAAMLADQAAYVLAAIGEHDHPIDRLFAQLRAVHAYHDGREGHALFLGQALAASAGDRMARVIEIGNRVFETHRQAQADAVRRGIAEGCVEACDVDALMATLRAAQDGLIVQRVMLGLDLAPVHEFLWKNLLEPLKRAPGPREVDEPSTVERRTARGEKTWKQRRTRNPR